MEPKTNLLHFLQVYYANIINIRFVQDEENIRTVLFQAKISKEHSIADKIFRTKFN